MATSLTPAQQDALAKLQSFQQQQGLDNYLAQRAKQYTSTPKGGTEWTGATALDNPFAGLKDFGKKTVQVSQGGGEEAPQEQEAAKTATDILNEKFGARLGHKSTFTKAYKKDDKGKPVEVDVNSLTPEELNSGDVVLYMGGATGGKERERMAQAYIPKGNKLIPVGDPSYYKGEHPDAQNVANAMKIAGIATLPFGGIGSLLSGVSSGIASGLSTLLPQSLANVAGNALTSGVLQGSLSKATGGNFSKGFKSGALSSVVDSGLNTYAGDMFKGLGELATPAKSIATSGITAALTGKKFDPTAALQGAAINYGLNQVGEAAGIDPKQQAAFTKFANFAMPMIAARRKPPGG